MSHRFHPEAAAEFAEAVQFYQERSRGLGRRFAKEVRAAIIRVVANPDRWPILEAGVRRCLVSVFPYAVLFTIEADFILILAVMHGKREPGYWRDRLRDRSID